MSVDVFTFGLNHVSAPLAVRERVSFPLDLIQPALTSLRNAFGTSVSEAAILSTCNRTEIYCAANQSASSQLPEWLAEFNRVEAGEVVPHIYQYQRNDAVRHAFRVASGLDSMVLGEPQILGQMKTAVREAQQAGALGTLLHQLFQRTFSVAKEVRSQTAIGAHSVSMAAAAVRMAERVLGDLSKSRVLFIGAGEMIQLCATHFAAANPQQIAVANRTVERAELLAGQFGATSIKLADLPAHLAEFDVVVSCTASSLPIIGLGLVERAARMRRHKPMVMVDLAVPRDIEPEAGRLADIYLYTVDDLGRMVQSGSDARRAAVVQAETIIETRVQNFMHWLGNREVVPAIIEYQQSAEALRNIELERARKRLARGDDPHEVLELLAHSLTQKHMHGPLAAINSSTGEQREYLGSLLPQLLSESSSRRH